jgi:hypothetical protein
MNARPVCTLAAVAIVAQHLEPRREVIHTKPSVEIMDSLAMLSTTTVDVVNSKKLNRPFLATRTRPSISLEGLDAERVPFGLAITSQFLLT